MAPDDTPAARAPDMASELQRFNAERRELLGKRPINPEGEAALGRLLSDPWEGDEE